MPRSEGSDASANLWTCPYGPTARPTHLSSPSRIVIHASGCETAGCGQTSPAGFGWAGRQGPASGSPVVARLAAAVEVLRCAYNFIRPHGTLRFGRVTRTSAMQDGIVGRALSWRDVFTWPLHPQLVTQSANFATVVRPAIVRPCPRSSAPATRRARPARASACSNAPAGRPSAAVVGRPTTDSSNRARPFALRL